MGDDERLAQVQHQDEKAGLLERIAVYCVVAAFGVGFWWVIIWGVARAIEMGRR